jgi:hypothetical protein
MFFRNGLRQLSIRTKRAVLIPTNLSFKAFPHAKNGQGSAHRVQQFDRHPAG